uniref:Uncharacterized protein n=1 Tax=Micrurus lemniscatus lemniscatus TaxID=129467 RepID=A0A2D4HFS4_MICLE
MIIWGKIHSSTDTNSTRKLLLFYARETSIKQPNRQTFTAFFKPGGSTPEWSRDPAREETPSPLEKVTEVLQGLEEMAVDHTLPELKWINGTAWLEWQEKMLLAGL